MRVGQDYVYVVYRDGVPFRHLSSKQSALFYIAACLDLFPNSSWEMFIKEVSGNG